MTHSGEFSLKTAGFCDIQDITELVQRVVSESGVRNGIACVANPGSTAGITTMEFEPAAVADLKEALDRLAPQGRRYRHDDTWGDGNGFAHLRSALVGTSVSFPIREGKLVLGTWQQIVFLDFDNRPRTRRVAVTIVGE